MKLKHKKLVPIVLKSFLAIVFLFLVDWHIKSSVREIIEVERTSMRIEIKIQTKELLQETLEDPEIQQQISDIVKDGVTASIKKDFGHLFSFMKMANR